jgi:hypothetical protein
MREQVKFWREPQFGNLELLHARYITHAFSRHTHDTYAIAVIEQGAEEFAYRGKLTLRPQGILQLLTLEKSIRDTRLMRQVGRTVYFTLTPAFLYKLPVKPLVENRKFLSFQPTFRRSLSKVDNIGDKLAQGSEESIFVHH